MAYAPLEAVYDGTILGRFTEKELGNVFEYTQNTQTPFSEYPFVVWCGPGPEGRYAKILKTVVYIVTDEAADGSPVVEKWFIKNHKRYKE